MMKFEESGLSEALLQAIKELGYETPMPVQSEVIPFLLGGGGDLIALAQTGTGKTAAFGLPVLQKTDLNDKSTQTLILSPTRELCMQISADLKDYARYLKGLRIIPVYGGASIRNQIEDLNKGAQIIVATPGRLLDLTRREVVDLSKVSTVVMDEADEMLNMGFLEDIDTILAAVPENRTTLLFSATMPDEIERLSMKYMREPKEIVIGGRNEGTSSVRHIYYTVRASEKYRTLKRIVDFYPKIYGIIFCRTKLETQEVSDKLIKDGYNVDALHGDLSQAQRDNVMQRFRLHNIQLLVATDVAARGIDVDDLTHVINYTLPDENEIYTHRSGRTGRAGKTGISITIVNLREKKRILQIEKSIRQTFEAGHIPTGKDICSKQIFNLIDSLENVEVNDEELEGILPAVYGKLSWLDKEEVIKRLVSLEFHRFLAYYQDDEDFDTEQDAKKEKGHAVGQR
ncbi:MAG: DEAD/DEAH box helicase, partial [Bacteroidales bacterium]|nr:DEAD/DEAH box helicase [Bacteroidales bacterium]